MCSEYAGAVAGSEGKPLGTGEIDMFQSTGLQNQNPQSDTDTDWPNCSNQEQHSSSSVQEFWLDPTQEHSLAHRATDNLFSLISVYGLLKFPVGLILTFR